MSVSSRWLASLKILTWVCSYVKILLSHRTPACQQPYSSRMEQVISKITLSLIFLFALSVATIAFAMDSKQLSPLDFLPMTPIVPDKTQVKQPKPASSESMCPTKVLSTHTIEGVFLGTECGDYCHGSIKLANGKEFIFFGNVDKIEKHLGKTGNNVSVTYELTQMWNEYGKFCAKNGVFKSGKILAALHPVQQTKRAPTISNTEVIANQRGNFTGEYKNKYGNLVFIEIIVKNRNGTTVQGASFSIFSSVGMGGQKADNQCEIGNTKNPKFAEKLDANRFAFYEDYDDERCAIVFNFAKKGDVTISQKGCQSACSFGIADFDGTYRLVK